MERMTRVRVNVLITLFSLVLVLFAARLFDIQFIETKGDTNNADTFITETRVKAARGEILDRNGNVLVGNRASYDLVINYFVFIDSDNPNQYLYQMVKLCQERGIDYAENFPVTKTRPFEYTLDEQNTTWRGYFQEYLHDLGYDSDITAPLLIQKLRAIYDLPDEWTDEEARAVIGLRYELRLRVLVPIANYLFVSDVDNDTLSEVLEMNIPGLNVEAATVREYHTDCAAHILGYVGAMNDEEWAYYEELGYPMDADVGKDGLEKAFDEQLHGTDGIRWDEVTSDGTVINTYYDPVPQAGNNVEISIDLSLQMVAEERLAAVLENLRTDENTTDGKDAEGGGVVAIDTRNGQILVCASYPTYDLSTFFEKYNETLQAPFDPLFNRALMATYPPGSTFKPCVSIAAIDCGMININTEIEDRGRYDRYIDSGFYADCLQYSSYGTVHENVNVVHALEVSCNYFYYWIGDHISDWDIIDATAKAMGLGEATGVELYEEIGYRANRETKRLLHGNNPDDAGWYQADAIMAAIGQSDNKFTPLQMCVYASVLANRGQRYKATFLSRVVSPDYREMIMESRPTLLSTFEISDQAYQAYTQGMYQVTQEPNGTARDAFAGFNERIRVAGKTGTAENGLGVGSDHAAFICFAPIDNPTIAIAVYGEKAGHGNAVASVARAILDAYFAGGVEGEIVTSENMPG